MSGDRGERAGIPPASPFWLAHHYPEDFSRCYAVGQVRLCARCVGLYAALFAALALQIGLRDRSIWPIPREPWLIAALSLPAVVDWARGRFDPETGTNPVRTLVGCLLGLALARTIFLNMTHPANVLSVAHFGGLLLVAVVVEVVSRPFRIRRRLGRQEGPMRG